MNPQPQDFGAYIAPLLQTRRVDLDTAEIVNQGVLFQEERGTTFAATYLKDHDVSMDIALRVLSHPRERRRD